MQALLWLEHKPSNTVFLLVSSAATLPDPDQFFKALVLDLLKELGPRVEADLEALLHDSAPTIRAYTLEYLAELKKPRRRGRKRAGKEDAAQIIRYRDLYDLSCVLFSGPVSPCQHCLYGWPCPLSWKRATRRRAAFCASREGPASGKMQINGLLFLFRLPHP